MVVTLLVSEACKPVASQCCLGSTVLSASRLLLTKAPFIRVMSINFAVLTYVWSHLV